MSHKQVAEELFLYFHELLDESEAGPADLSNNNQPQIKSEVESNHQAKSEQQVTVESPKELVKEEQKPTEEPITTPVSTAPTSPAPTRVAKTDSVAVQASQTEPKKEVEPSTTPAVNRSTPTTSELEKTTSKEPQPIKPSTTESSSNPAEFEEPSPQAPNTNPQAPNKSYEQHKQRLEKMLQQVTALNNKPAESSASVAAPTETPVDSHSATESDISAEESEPVISFDYQEMPPLTSEWLENGRPNWAQEKLDILLIEVNGLHLAVPLVALGQIQQIDEELTQLFGQSEWFMGLQQSPAGNIKTVNTAKFVMPERYQEEHDYKFVVSINGLAWGLAVDRIHQPISVDPDEIRWRTRRGNRPWMAGTLKDQMCVLLDIPALGEILQDEDKNH